MSNTAISHAPVRRAALALGTCLAVAVPAGTLGPPAHAAPAERATVQRLQAHLKPSGDLNGSVTGGSHCATGVSRTLIGKILAHPGRYYFNVHNMQFPAGAIQGKL